MPISILHKITNQLLFCSEPDNLAGATSRICAYLVCPL